DRLRAAVRNPVRPHPALGDDAGPGAAQRPREEPLVVPVGAGGVEDDDARVEGGGDGRGRPLLVGVLVRPQPHAAEDDAQVCGVEPGQGRELDAIRPRTAESRSPQREESRWPGASPAATPKPARASSCARATCRSTTAPRTTTAASRSSGTSGTA